MDIQKAKYWHHWCHSSSNEKVIRGLREIKKLIISDRHNIDIFRNLNLVSVMIYLIQRPNEEILNSTLSILSLFCMDVDSRLQVFSAGGTKHLVTILRCAESEKLQQRTCRTIGNQCGHAPSAQSFLKEGVLGLVIDLLQKSTEEETKTTAIRTVRLLASSGENCQKIVSCGAVGHICTAGLHGSPSPTLLRVTLKAVAHFSRILHVDCAKQMMASTGDMLLIMCHSSDADTEIREYVLRTVVNLASAAFLPNRNPHWYLADADVLDHLSIARAPIFLVSELTDRCVPTVEEEQLILALCKFCINPCDAPAPRVRNYSAYMYNRMGARPATFFSRCWPGLVECGGVEVMVKLLQKHRDNTTIRDAIVKALVCVEYSYDYHVTVMKHFLVAKLTPILIELFDESLEQYKNCRSLAKDAECCHLVDEIKGNKRKFEDWKIVSGNEKNMREHTDEARTESEEEKKNGEPIVLIKKEEELKKDELKQKDEERKQLVINNQQYLASEGTYSAKVVKEFSDFESSTIYYINDSQHLERPKKRCLVDIAGNLSNAIPLHAFVANSARSSVSCSPHSGESSGGVSPVSGSRSEKGGSFSPTYSGKSSCSGTLLGSPARSCSPVSSVSSSPLYGDISSPPPLSELIWMDTEETDFDCNLEEGIFSPTIMEPLDSDDDLDPIIADHQVDSDDDTDPIIADHQVDSDDDTDPIIADHQVDKIKADYPNVSNVVDNVGIMSQMIIDVTDNLDHGKNPQHLSLVETAILHSPAYEMSTDNCRTPDRPVAVNEVNSLIDTTTAKFTNHSITNAAELSFITAVSDCLQNDVMTSTFSPKSLFRQMGKIKFRVGTTGKKKRLPSISGGSLSSLNRNAVSQLDGMCMLPDSQGGFRESLPSQGVPSAVNTEEKSALLALDSLVRVMNLLTSVKEAIGVICRDLVPRLILYFSIARMPHLAAGKMMKKIGRNSLSIPSLLDSDFIPYAAVELAEVSNQPRSNGCQGCSNVSAMAQNFLDQLAFFFGHGHMFGRCEMANRWRVGRDVAKRLKCLLALPHVAKCPKLLHEFMLMYPGLDLLFETLQSDVQCCEKVYIYGVAAIGALSDRLQLKRILSEKNVTATNFKLFPFQLRFNTSLKNLQTFTAAADAVCQSCHLERDMQCESKCYYANETVHDVTLTASDGTQVTARREFLADKAEALRMLLTGGFVESTQQSVHLPGIQRGQSLRMLMHFLYGCSCQVVKLREEILENNKQSDENLEKHNDTDKIEIMRVSDYIDLFFLAEMYLLPDLQEFTMRRMIDAIVNVDDVLDIFHRGIGRVAENVVVQALIMVLVRPMRSRERATWLKQLLASEHGPDVFYNLREILKHNLELFGSLCNCDVIIKHDPVS